MTDLPTLRTLLSDLEALDGPSRELDARLAVAFSDHPHRRRLPTEAEECEPGTFWLLCGAPASLQTAPSFTSDPTSAIALCERVFPDLHTELHIFGSEFLAELESIEVFPNGWKFSRYHVGESVLSLAHALCIVIVKAEIARREV